MTEVAIEIKNLQFSHATRRQSKHDSQCVQRTAPGECPEDGAGRWHLRGIRQADAETRQAQEHRRRRAPTGRDSSRSIGVIPRPGQGAFGEGV